MRELVRSKRRLMGVVHMVRVQLEADIAAMRNEDAELASAEEKYLAQLADDKWTGLRNTQLIAVRLQGIRQKRVPLQQALSEAVSKAFRQRIAEERLAEQVAELDLDIAALDEEESASERTGLRAATFSYAQDP
jgi:hypothetical protein